MSEILGDVRALANVKRWAKNEGVWAKNGGVWAKMAFCGQKCKFAGQTFFNDQVLALF